jgi:5-formyltetrahydrofolate cyclo-ligase
MKTAKENIRKQIKSQLKALSADEKLAQSTLILKKLESSTDFQQANTILLFWSLPDEIETHSFIEKWATKKKILLPVVVNDLLILKPFEGKEKMITGAFNILEPTSKPFSDFEQIDLSIIPGVAFDREGNRLGRGKGFYDKLLPKINSKKIGICFNFQLIENIPHESWDEKMDLVISSIEINIKF